MKDSYQEKRGYRSENINSRGFRSKKAWVQIKEHMLTWVRQISRHEQHVQNAFFALSSYYVVT